jgi:glutathione S-transferase
MPPPLTLISFELCPFVQRAAIVLTEKNVTFDRINIDLASKPEWFKAISPLGKVPLLKVGEEVLFESSIIVEYLEEALPNALHPADLLEKARHRAWMEFGSSMIGDLWVVETSTDRQTFDSKVRVLREKFTRLETQLSNGPYFSGEKFAIVDAVFAPIFRYFDVFDKISDFGILSDLPNINAWRNALGQRPSVVGAVSGDYAIKFDAFLKKHNGVIMSFSE